LGTDIWLLEKGEGPLVATAIHNGHALRPDLASLTVLSAEQRRHEEDPFTAAWTSVAPTRIIGLRSRFGLDLNRSRKKTVYLRPDDAWGLTVWRADPPPEVLSRSREEYDAFYRMLSYLLDDKHRAHGRILILDIHSYNHRRRGPDKAPVDPAGNPQVNVGTRREMHPRWRGLVERFMAEMAAFDFPGGRLDVRENVKFRGGHLARFILERYGEDACVLSLEFKKFFMDEWTGEADPALLAAIGAALESTIPGLIAELADA